MYDDRRVDWVDYAKGFCIIFVVMMHATLGVEKAAGAESWMRAVVEFARPFRMPDFFLISGLFLARVIDRAWRDYLDRKVVHFVYFYVIWLTLQFAFKAPGFIAADGAGGALQAYLTAFVEPFGTMWFIYLLPIFFVVTKLLRRVPWWFVFAVAAILQMAPIHTGWIVIDEFAGRFVFFFAGYVFAEAIFRFAAWAKDNVRPALVALPAWALVNGALVFAGLADLPGVALILGFLGAGAVVMVSALLSRVRMMSVLRYCGRNSIVIYLAFFLPLALTRMVLLKTGLVTDLGTVALLVTVAGVAVPLLVHRAIRDTWLRWLFERPDWAKLSPRRHARAAEVAA